jgi:hypothetical protein
MSARGTIQFRRSEHGSVVLVALMFTALLGIGITSFVTVCYRSMQLSNRSFNGARSIQFAEMGMEEVLWSLKNNDWSSWTISGSTATRTIGGFNYSDGCAGEIHLIVQNYNTTAATFVVEGQTTLPDGSLIRKQLTATATQTPVFTNAIFSSTTTNFIQGGTIDSFNSSDGPYSAASAGFSAIVTGSSVGSSTAGSVIANNANIKGYIAYAGLAPTFGSSGSLSGPGSPANPRVDSSRYSTSPWQSFPDVKPVTGGSPLPAGDATIGTPGAKNPSIYYTDQFSLGDSQVLTISGPVVVDVRGNLVVNGSAKILVQPTGSLELHFTGGIFLGGQGVENQTLDPKKVTFLSNDTYEGGFYQLFWTATPFYGTIYMPRGDPTLLGEVDIYGSVVAHSVTLDIGVNPQVHYDLSLASAASASGLTPSYQLSNWREITDSSELTQF